MNQRRRWVAPQVMCQILRTQPQYGKEDIKASAYGQTAWGRKPEQHGRLYLFVITNSSDAGTYETRFPLS